MERGVVADPGSVEEGVMELALSDVQVDHRTEKVLEADQVGARPVDQRTRCSTSAAV